MNLSELKLKPAAELIEIAQEMGIEGTARSRKQDIIFSILKSHAKKGEDIFGTACPSGISTTRPSSAMRSTT